MALFHRTKIAGTEYGSGSEGPPAPGPRSAGDALRQQREALHRDLKDVASALRIKPVYLTALEEGRPDRLPGPAYAAGFVRAYGDYLGLDGAEILRRFRLEASGLDTKPDLSFPMPLGEKSIPGGAMLLVALILAICGYGTWYYLSTGERARPERITEVPVTLLPAKLEPHVVKPPLAPVAETTTPQNNLGPAGNLPSPIAASGIAPARTEGSGVPPAPPPTASASLSTSATPASLADPDSARKSNNASEPPAAGAGHDAGSGPAIGDEPGAAPRTFGAVGEPARIVLAATVDSWIQIRDADHSLLFTGLLKPGEQYRVPDRPGLSMRVGNAGGLNVTIDGKPVPPLGPAGAVRNVVLEPAALAFTSTIH
jgi:cytoskeleton protein RodZ